MCPKGSSLSYFLSRPTPTPVLHSLPWWSHPITNTGWYLLMTSNWQSTFLFLRLRFMLVKLMIQHLHLDVYISNWTHSRLNLGSLPSSLTKLALLTAFSTSVDGYCIFLVVWARNLGWSHPWLLSFSLSTWKALQPPVALVGSTFQENCW